MAHPLPSTVQRRAPFALAAWITPWIATVTMVALLVHGLVVAPVAKAQLLAGDICFTAGKDGAPAQGTAHDHCALCASMDAVPAGRAPRAEVAAKRGSVRFDAAGIVARRMDPASQRAPPA